VTELRFEFENFGLSSRTSFIPSPYFRSLSFGACIGGYSIAVSTNLATSCWTNKKRRTPLLSGWLGEKNPKKWFQTPGMIARAIRFQSESRWNGKENRLKMPRRSHVLAGLVTRLQFRNAQMFDDPSHVRLLRIMAFPSIILIPPPDFPSSSQ
jgi:hypothetical protein